MLHLTPKLRTADWSLLFAKSLQDPVYGSRCFGLLRLCDYRSGANLAAGDGHAFDPDGGHGAGAAPFQVVADG